MDALLHSLTPSEAKEEWEEASLVISLGRASFVGMTEAWPCLTGPGESEQRPLNQFILETVFFFRQREEGGT